ncbi:MAG: aldo/keto reductase [Candidatus Taylorbacteria bacterium]|nr:aldo/keto reductase [Candidatus Taylorbacteria bacterium]
MNESNTLLLNNGARMPMLGLGTWNAPKDTVGATVEMALTRYGYSHIDCAHVYENEPEVGEALHRVFTSGARKRDNVFITSKLWNYDHAKADVRTACEKTLRDLQLDYLDLYLMHFGVASPHDGRIEPVDKDGFLVPAKVSVRETWEAMEALVDAGLVKAIGISNFTAPMIVDLLTYAKIVSAINQIELHPYCQQPRMLEFCKHLGIAVTAYSPLGSQVEKNAGKPPLLEDATIKRIADAHGKTPAQVCLRWGIQRGTVVIPKSSTPEHIKQNAEIFSFKLSTIDIADLNALDCRLRYVDPYEWWEIPYFD